MWHIGISGLHPRQRPLSPPCVLQGLTGGFPKPDGPNAITYPSSTRGLLWQETHSISGCCARNPFLWGYLSLSRS